MTNHISELKRCVMEAAKAYYQGESTMPDSQYDDMVEQLEQAGIPVPVAGWYVPSREKASHDSPMLSLGKIYSLDDLSSWLRGLPQHTDILVEPKWDGLALSLVYEEGRLVRAVTRGDGYIGENVTTVAWAVCGLPDIPTGFTGSVRGEVVLNRSELAVLNSNFEIEYSNCRNAAAGIINRRDDLAVQMAGYLSFFSHDVEFESGEYWFRTRHDSSHVNDIMSAVSAILERREDIDSDIDGAVIKVVDEEVRRSLGNSRTAPRWALAYKYEEISKETTLLDVQWSTGRTGRVVPVAVFEPVELAGAQVRNATLHNVDILNALSPLIGDKVSVKRAGEVIPYLSTVTERVGTEPVVLPTSCPYCNTELVRDGVDLVCRGSSCNLSGKLLYATRMLGVDGIGPSIIDSIVAYKELEDLVSGIGSLLDTTIDDLEALPRFGTIMAKKTHAAIQVMRNSDLGSWIAALGIPAIGPIVSQGLAEHYSSLSSLSSALRFGTVQVPGIGLSRVTQLQESVQVIDQLEHELFRRNIFPEPYSREVIQSRWTNVAVVLTGNLPGVQRKDAEDYLASRGAILQGRVSAMTRFLIAGERAGSKLKRARELEVEVIDGFDFVQELEGSTET